MSAAVSVPALRALCRNLFDGDWALNSHSYHRPLLSSYCSDTLVLPWLPMDSFPTYIHVTSLI